MQATGQFSAATAHCCESVGYLSHQREVLQASTAVYAACRHALKVVGGMIWESSQSQQSRQPASLRFQRGRLLRRLQQALGPRPLKPSLLQPPRSSQRLGQALQTALLLQGLLLLLRESRQPKTLQLSCLSSCGPGWLPRRRRRLLGMQGQAAKQQGQQLRTEWT